MNLFANSGEAFRAIEALTGVTLTLSALEFLTLKAEFRQSGFFGLENRHAQLTVIILVVQLCLGMMLVTGIVSPPFRPLLTGATLVSLMLLHAKISGGLEAADQMLTILAGAQFLRSLAPQSESVQAVALWFIALQSIASYLIAGVTKLHIPAWRDGSFISAMLRTEAFGHPVVARYVSTGVSARFASAFILTFECAAPLALVTGLPGALVFCFFGICFHLVNAYLLGLNLFVWSFAATYPAVLYCAQQVW